jgi:hypothetical protein
LQGFNKNGGTSPGGGATNCRIAYLKGYGDERICAFVQVNADIEADPILDTGLDAIRERLARPPGAVTPSATPTTGLRQSVYWEEASVARSASAVLVPVVELGITIGGETASRTNLLGSGNLAGGRHKDMQLLVELSGTLRVQPPGPRIFRLSSDDGSLLWIDGTLVIDNDGDHGPLSIESLPVQAGLGDSVSFRVRWYNKVAGGSLFLEWKVPGSPDYEPVPVANFSTGA